MRINFKKLKTLPVKTASDTMLGHVHDVIIDSEAHVVVQYEVHSSLLRHETYLINREQVISVTEKAMIVDDSIASQIKNKARLDPLPVSPKPAIMREKAN